MRSRVRPGGTVVIIGPGTIGLLAVAWFTLYHPLHIILVGRRAHDEGPVKQPGPMRLVNLQREDARAVVNSLTDGRGADVVFEAAGHIDAVPLAFDLARRGGTVVLEGIAGGSQRLALDPDLFCLKDLRVVGILACTYSVFGTRLSRMSHGVVWERPVIRV